MENISIKRAAIISFIARYSNVLVQLIINAILARLLTPDDYGIVAIITVFISFFTIIADMGVGPAIIQHKDLSKREISDIFIFTVLTAVVISIVFGIFSYPLSIFYGNKVYITLGLILSVAVFFNILNIVPNSLLLKNKQFKSLGIRTIWITVLGGILTIFLALKGAKYYALVINSVFIGFITFITNFYCSEIKIYWGFKLESIKKIKSYSTYQFGFNFINYFSRNLDNLLIGKFLGQVPLGYYDKAYKLMLYPVQNLTSVITPVLHPILSEHQKDKEYIYERYIIIVKILSLVGLFFGVYCFFAAKEVMLIIFGWQWVDSIPAFTILSLSIWPQVVTSSTGAIFQSLGATKELFKCGLITTGINVSLIITGLIMGRIEFVAVGVVISYAFSFIIAYKILVGTIFRKSFLAYLKSFIPHIAIAIIMSIGMIIFDANIVSIFKSAIYKLFIGVIFYSIGLFITKEYKNFKTILKK